MNEAKKIAVKFFKRNPGAKAAHVVLNVVTDDLKKATLFKRSIHAKTVTSFLRTECADELGESTVPNENDQTKQEIS